MRYLLLTLLVLCTSIANAQSKKKQKQYSLLIFSADSAFQLKNYPFARSKYVKASSTLSKEQYPKDRTLECDKLIISQNAEYKKIIPLADSCYVKENWIEAKKYYLQALGVKPFDQYASDQAKNCNFAIVAAEALESRYQETVKKADSCYRYGSWSCAKASYEAAVKMKPQESYPAQKIKECDTKMLKQVDQERYAIAITEGDQLYDAQNYKAAKLKYIDAVNINPNAVYPKERIAECDQRINEDQ